MRQVRPSIDELVGYAVKRLQQRVRHAGEAALRPYGLSMPQYAVLAVLAESPGASGAELARRCFVTRQTMTGLLQGLRAMGLVDRSAESGAGRAQPMALTRTGLEQATVARRAVDRVERRMTSALDAADRTRLLELLDTCAAALAPDEDA